jgi:hypothetical protein
MRDRLLLQLRGSVGDDGPGIVYRADETLQDGSSELGELAGPYDEVGIG